MNESILVVNDDPEGWQQQRLFFVQANRRPVPSIVILNGPKPLIYWSWETRNAEAQKIRDVSYQMNRICCRYKSGSVVRNNGRAFQIGVAGFEVVKGFKTLDEAKTIAQEMNEAAQLILEPTLISEKI
jgi:hypothetical protein